MTSLDEQISEGMSALGLEADGAIVAALALHARRVLEVNQVMNLTSIPEADFVPMHILDSLSALPFLANEPSGEFADLGSGAGYPAIPLALTTGRPVSLVESVRKKAAFLEALCEELRLEATVHPIRAEELALVRPGAFAVVTARALSALPSLVELAAPLLRPGGALVCMKGKPDVTELARGDRAAELCGLARERVATVRFTGLEAERTIVVYRRVAEPRSRLPRRNGMAQRQPLA
jgi:16S rRNA (guanine527-N7)-methyltransferase